MAGFLMIHIIIVPFPEKHRLGKSGRLGVKSGVKK